MSIGRSTPQQHADRSNGIGDRRHQPRHHIGKTNAFDDLWQEESDAVGGRLDGEIDQGKYEYARVGEGLKKAEVAGALDVAALLLQRAFEPFLLCRLEPAGHRWPVSH